MGRAAVKAAAKPAVAAVVSTGAPVVTGAARECVNGPDCEGEEDGEPQDDSTGPARTQAELSIAVDSTGQHIVVGFNDFRGFLSNPISVSGFMYSDNGGLTFVDGGQLPTPGNETIGTTATSSSPTRLRRGRLSGSPTASPTRA